MNCPTCGAPLTKDGTQHNPIRLVKFDLMTCNNERCSRRGFTFAYNRRAMTRAEIESYKQSGFYERLGISVPEVKP